MFENHKAESEDRRVVTLTTSSQRHQEEGVLHDVLQELDRERTRRAELEAQMRVIAEEQALQSKNPPEEQECVIEKREWLALETERDELVQLVEALTNNNDAITAASESSSTSAALPLHVVRLLEIMPWDQRARQYTIATEEVYEWQIYDVKGGKWTSQLRQFPPFFRTMPITKPTPGRVMDENLSSHRSRRIFGGESPPKQCVMTDAAATRVFNVNDGFPLPKDGGTWKWIGGWRIDKRVVATPKLNGGPKSKVDCDDDGWSYAEDPRHFQTNPTELCWDSPGETSESSVYRRGVRRRKWTRRRALLSYPGASERTMEYLKSMAENSIMEITNSKLNDQLIETKVLLTQCEEKLMHMEDLEKKVERLETENTRLRDNSSKLYTELNKSKSKLSDCEQKLATSRKGRSFMGRLSPELKGEGGGGKVLKRGNSDSSEAGSDKGGSRRSLLENVENIGTGVNKIVSDSRDKLLSRSDEVTAPGSDGDDTSSSSHSQNVDETSESDGGESFDWKRFGVFEKLKRSPAVKSLESWRSPSQSVAAPANSGNDGLKRDHQDLALPTLK